MNTFRNICKQLQSTLKPCICWCSSPDNLQQVYDLVKQYLQALLDAGHIVDYGHKCGRDDNPNPAYGIHPQMIVVSFGIAMPDGSNPQGLIRITTQVVEVYLKWNDELDSEVGTELVEEDPTDAFDRAMSVF